MHSCYEPIIVMTLALVVAGAGVFGGDGQTQPSPYCLRDDVQYFTPGAGVGLKATSRKPRAILGDLLFTDVVSVHFIGPGHPANPDGSLGGLAAGHEGTEMKIYEQYIVLDATDADGTTFRTLHAYDKIGKIEQRISRKEAGTK